MKYSDIEKFTGTGNYHVNVSWKYLDDTLLQWENEELIPLDLCPDFQRGHVWTLEQRIAYVEYCLRGGLSGRDIYFNCNGWMGNFDGPFVLVDGLQRLTSVRMFLTDRLRAFGHLCSEFEDELHLMEPCFDFYVNNLETRAEVLKWYLEMNSGGVIHSKDELDRVARLLDVELEK